MLPYGYYGSTITGVAVPGTTGTGPAIGVGFDGSEAAGAGMVRTPVTGSIVGT